MILKICNLKDKTKRRKPNRTQEVNIFRLFYETKISAYKAEKYVSDVGIPSELVPDTIIFE